MTNLWSIWFRLCSVFVLRLWRCDDQTMQMALSSRCSCDTLLFTFAGFVLIHVVLYGLYFLFFPFHSLKTSTKIKFLLWVVVVVFTCDHTTSVKSNLFRHKLAYWDRVGGGYRILSLGYLFPVCATSILAQTWNNHSERLVNPYTSETRGTKVMPIRVGKDKDRLCQVCVTPTRVCQPPPVYCCSFVSFGIGYIMAEYLWQPINGGTVTVTPYYTILKSLESYAYTYTL